MNTANDQIRYKKVLGAKILIESGLYHEMLEDIIDAILSGKTKKARDLLEYLDLYNKQIHEYQKAAKLRASCSFYCALIAMFCGFAFIFWGGQHMLREINWDQLAAGFALAAIGGSISAFIAKTFLDVHRLSIQQLNQYFQQPVAASNVLMAKLLADNLSDSPARQKAYIKIISCLLSLTQEKPKKTNPHQTKFH